MKALTRCHKPIQAEKYLREEVRGLKTLKLLWWEVLGLEESQ
jgi:hypothetical protein